MMRSIFVAAVLCAACTHQQQVRDLETTTTSAIIRPNAGAGTLEPGAAVDQDVSTVPTALSSTSPDDARIAALVEAYDDAAVARATLAVGRAKDQRVRDYAQLVRDRHHDARLRLGNVSASPDVTVPPTTLNAVDGQSQIDFDRAYLETEAREQSALLQLLDSATPETKTVELRKRLVALRPQVAELWVRAFELQQVLAKE